MQVVVVVLLALVAVACSGDDADTDRLSPGAALAAADAYFVAYNSGDAAAVASLWTSDVEFADGYRSGGEADEYAREYWELELAWYTSQGTVRRSHTCALVDDQPARGTTVACDYETLDALTQAVAALPVPTTTVFTLTSSGISRIHHVYAPQAGQPDFVHVGEPFQAWLAANRPDVTCLWWYVARFACEDLATVEQYRETGSMIAELAQEWAAYLSANGCGYLDGC